MDAVAGGNVKHRKYTYEIVDVAKETSSQSVESVYQFLLGRYNTVRLQRVSQKLTYSVSSKLR